MNGLELIIKTFPEFQELMENTGSEFALVYDPLTQKVKRIRTSLLQGGTENLTNWKSNDPEYPSGYPEDFIVQWNLKLWISKVNNNLNNIPGTGSAFWNEVSKQQPGLNYWKPGVYTTDPTFIFYNHLIWWLDTEEMVDTPFNSTNIQNEINAGIWKDIITQPTVVIDAEDATEFDPENTYIVDGATIGGYKAGAIVSYKNEASPIVQFQTFAIYVANADIAQGLSPEDSASWIFSGDSIQIGGNTSKIDAIDEIELRSIQNPRNGDSVIYSKMQAVYKFNENNQNGIKPFQDIAGSWIKAFDLTAYLTKTYESIQMQDGITIPLEMNWGSSRSVKLTNGLYGVYSLVILTNPNPTPEYLRKSTIIIDCTSCNSDVNFGWDIFPFLWRNSTGLTSLQAGKRYQITVENAIVNNQQITLLEYHIFNEASEAGGSGGHTLFNKNGTEVTTRDALQAKGRLNFVDNAITERTELEVDSDDIDAHIDGVNEAKHTGNQVGVFAESIVFVSGEMTFNKHKYIQSHQITGTFQFTKTAGTHYINATIEACFIASGVTGHKPTFSADFNIQYDNWDNTNGAKNLIRMRYLPEGILTEIRKI